jgi:ribonuclease HI
MAKEIDIFIRVLQTPPSKRGKAIVLYRYGNRIKELYFSTLETTQNRSIILAAVIAVEGLKYSCHINIYTQSNFGFAFMKNAKKWVNRDMGDLLTAALINGGHSVKYIDCSQTDEGKDYQQELAVRLRNI